LAKFVLKAIGDRDTTVLALTPLGGMTNRNGPIFVVLAKVAKASKEGNAMSQALLRQTLQM
jgi:hypothetical protein